MLLDNPMPPGAVTDALRCTSRSRRRYEGMGAVARFMATAQVEIDALIERFKAWLEALVDALRQLAAQAVPA